MPKHYFTQELHYAGMILNGRTVPFEPLAGNQAVIALDDSVESDRFFIEGLRASIGRNSIAPLTESEYHEKKNEWPLRESNPKSQRETLRIMGARNPAERKVAAEEGSKPIAPVSTQQPKPATINNTLPPASSVDLLDQSFKPAIGKIPKTVSRNSTD